MQRKHNNQDQLGWNCFDVAIGISRDDLVKFALDKSSDISIRKILAPEIRHAAALTATNMNLKAEGKDAIAGQAALPVSMETEELKKLYKNYQDALENMKDVVADCSTSLGYPEGSILPLSELDAFFANTENRTSHNDAYETFKNARDEKYTTHESAFFNYCESEVVFKTYISDYYGKEQWVAFQRNVAGEQTKSMIDIAAMMTQSCIEIYQLEDKNYKEIYKTEQYGKNTKRIEYSGNCHFYELVPDVIVDSLPIVAKDATKKTGTTTTALSSPPGKELLLSRGFAGSIYQVKVLMLLAFTAYCEKKRFHLYTEAEGYGKFDDCVLFLEDEMQAMQVKHSFDPKGCYLLEHLVGGGAGTGKKATLSKYFDSWLTIEALRHEDPKKYKDEIKYLFYTNHALSAEDGLSAIYDETTGRFSKKLLDGTLDDAKAVEARQAILRSIYEYASDIQSQINAACKGVIACFTASKNTKGKAKGALVIASDKSSEKEKILSKEGKILLALLLKHKCIEKENEYIFFKKNRYKFTTNFISSKELSKLPPILKLLRELLVKHANFKVKNQFQDFRFYISDNQFSSLELNNKSTVVDILLKVGHLSILGNDFLFCDLSKIDEALAKPAPECVRNFFEQFQVKVKQPNEAEMTKVLENKIGEHFNSTDSGFYHYFYQSMLNFLLDASDASISDENVDQLFEEARRALERNQLVGHSLRYEHHLRSVHKIELKLGIESTLIDDFLKNDDRKIMVCHGHSDWLVAMTVCSELQKLRDNKAMSDDSFGFIDAGYAVLDVDEKVFAVDQFKLLVIDHAEKLSEDQLQRFIAEALRNAKKIVLLTVNTKHLEQRIKKETNIEIDSESFHEIARLSKAIIENNIAANISAEKGILLGDRFLSFTEMIASPDYCDVMSDPHILAAMLKNAESMPEEVNSNQRLFVKPTLTYKNPIYKVEAVLAINYRIIQLDKADDDIAKIAQILKLELDKFSDNDKTLSLKKLIESKRDHEKPTPVALCIKNSEHWKDLSETLRGELATFSKLIFIGEDVPSELGQPLQLCHHMTGNEIRYRLADATMFKYMPETSEYLCEDGTLYDSTLVSKPSHSCRRVLLSDYGSGKTYLTEELLRDKSSQFGWTVRIACKTLSEDLLNQNLEYVAQYYLDIPFFDEYQRQILQCDIRHGNVLWILDGFDEMLTEQRKKLEPLIIELAKQPYCLITSRPNAAPYIPLQPDQFIALQRFDKKQIEQFVKGYFVENHEQQEKAEKLISLWQTKNQLSLLGKPLMCRIACEIIASGTDVENLQDITLASLFDYFIRVNLIKYHRDHNRIPVSRLSGKRLFHLSAAMIERLKQVAYAKLFPRHKDVCLLPDSVLDFDLLKLGLVTEVTVRPATDAEHYLFDHQTQLEYFAALYWVEKLLQVPVEQRKSHVEQIWSNDLYNVELRVVWQFVAGIVSSSQSSFLIGNGCNVFDVFCDFLLHSAEDLVGKVHQELLSGCYFNMQQSRLKDTKYYKEFETEIAVNSFDLQTDDENIQVFNVPGKKSLTSEQIVADYLYTKLHTLPDSSSISDDEDIDSIIKESLEKYDYSSKKDDHYVLARLVYLKKYLEQSDIDQSLVSQIKDRMLAIYSEYDDNNESYVKAYALLTFMIDNDLIALADCVAAFTKNFNQKNCVLDVVRRLNTAKLLKTEHLDILFITGRPRFWDQDAGLPAVLLLRARFNTTMAEMLRYNVVVRNSGDWEIDRAIEILTEICQETYDVEQLQQLLNLIIEISSAEGTEVNQQQIKQFEDLLFASQDENLLVDIITQNLVEIKLDNVNVKHFSARLQLLYRFCNHYDLAVVIEDNHLRILGRIEKSVHLANVPVIQDFMRDTLRALRDDSKVDETESYRKLGVCEAYQVSLNENSNFISTKIKLERLRELSSLLPPPTQIELGMKKEFSTLKEKTLPDKDLFSHKVAVLQAFGRSLSFVDEFLGEYAKSSFRAGYWNIDGGIPATAYLGNDFGVGAYEYLKYCHQQLHESYCVHTALNDIAYDTLSNPTAICFVLKTMLVLDIIDSNYLTELGVDFVEKLKSIEEKLLVQGFIKLLQSTDLSDKQSKKLNLLSENWKDKIRSQLEQGIDQAKLTETSSSMFYRPQKDKAPSNDDQKRRYSF